jgi:hypothetical protein
MYVIYYASILHYWQLIKILVRTNHSYLRVGCHRGKCHAATPRSCQGCRGASSLPHRGAARRIEVPIRVATHLPVVLDGGAVVLT